MKLNAVWIFIKKKKREREKEGLEWTNGEQKGIQVAQGL